MLERIWHQNQAVLRSIIGKVLQDPGSVEDVLQDSFAKLIQSGRRFSTPNETFQYIRKTVLHTSIDRYRTLKRRGPHLPVSEDRNPFLGTASNPDPLHLLIRKEAEAGRRALLDEVQSVLPELPENQREAIHIVFYHGRRTIKEICRERGLPYSTLRSHLLAALKRIRGRLKEKGFLREEKPGRSGS